jgi:transposase
MPKCVPESVCECARTSDQHQLISGTDDMNAEKEIVCAADIQRDFLVATMISRSGLKLQEQFGMDEDGLLANAFQIRNIEGKKTDRLDSEQIAIYCLNDLIKTSRIYPKDYRELRSITRSREALVNARFKLKNQIHQLLAVCCIKLSSVISDSFAALSI